MSEMWIGMIAGFGIGGLAGLVAGIWLVGRELRRGSDEFYPTSEFGRGPVDVRETSQGRKGK